jgi:predicted neuraminidase
MSGGNRDNDLSLQPVLPNLAPGPEYGTGTRKWQGIPSLERAPNGRLWALWYSGGVGEGPDNYVLLVTSDDDGHTWSEPKLVVDPPSKVRAFDPNLWHDPLGRLWMFWAQSYDLFDGRAGVWAIVCENSDSPAPRWSAPRRLCNGIMMNKPTVLSSGEWLLPAAVWTYLRPSLPEMAAERFSNVVCSTDQGKTWTRRGGADVPDRAFDEHSVVERRDGSLWMLVRTKYGIGESVSKDRGITWEPGRPTSLGGPCARFFIRRLSSGRLLLVNHYKFTGRSHLTALLSEDDGVTWRGGLLLDERPNVSYPDGVQACDGRIYIIYDRERYKDREILMAVFREEDALAGRCVSKDARLKQLVNRAG